MIWYVVGAILLFDVLIAAAACYSGRRRADRNIVRDALDNAWDGGHFEPGEGCHGMGARELAYDLRCYAEETQDMPFEFVVRCVRTWMKEKGLQDGD